MGFWNTALVYVAPVFLGGAAGWLTGQTEADSTVVAAVLPAVLTGGGGALLAFKLKRENNVWARDFLNACGFVVIFSVALVLSMHGALTVKDLATDEDRETQRKRYAEDLDFRRESLLQCSWNEARVNSVRETAGLSALPPEAFCDIGPLGGR